MRNKNARKGDVHFQLFSFLDVLLCTLGGLIIMLTIAIHRARAYVEEKREEAKSVTAELDEKLTQEAEEERWRQQVLEEARAEKTQEMANQRLELSHLEDHIRRLQEKWKQLTAEAEALGQMRSEGMPAANGSDPELARVLAEVEDAKRALDAASAEAAQRKRGYCIVPYDGPHGTRRRPIYIECTEAGITLQPEGVVLTAEDFAGPLTSGNPFDAALRSIREYLARNGDVQRNGEPYPLLIVRPDGAVAYAAARTAMKSWDSEFGYELVGDDLPLDFGKPDPHLVELLHRSIADARERQSLLAAAMPSQYRERGLVAATTGGGFVLEETGQPAGAGSPGARSARKDSTSKSRAAGVGSGGNERVASDGGRAESRDLPGSQMKRTRRSRSGDTGPALSSADPSVTAPDPNAPTRFTAHESGDQTSDKSAQALSAGVEKSTGNANKNSRPLAKTRGANWGTPGANRGLTGITRPIEVVCAPDRLVILPERGTRAKSKEVPMPGETFQAIDPFMDVVRAHVDNWGLALSGGYWKPVLSVTVQGGGEQRFHDLQSLLEGSGIDVRRKGG